MVFSFFSFFFSLSLTREKNQILSRLFFVVTAHSFTNVLNIKFTFFLDKFVSHLLSFAMGDFGRIII